MRRCGKAEDSKHVKTILALQAQSIILSNKPPGQFSSATEQYLGENEVLVQEPTRQFEMCPEAEAPRSSNMGLKHQLLAFFGLDIVLMDES